MSFNFHEPNCFSYRDLKLYVIAGARGAELCVDYSPSEGEVVDLAAANEQWQELFEALSFQKYPKNCIEFGNRKVFFPKKDAFNTNTRVMLRGSGYDTRVIFEQRIVRFLQENSYVLPKKVRDCVNWGLSNNAGLLGEKRCELDWYGITKDQMEYLAGLTKDKVEQILENREQLYDKAYVQFVRQKISKEANDILNKKTQFPKSLLRYEALKKYCAYLWDKYSDAWLEDSLNYHETTDPSDAIFDIVNVASEFKNCDMFDLRGIDASCEKMDLHFRDTKLRECEYKILESEFNDTLSMCISQDLYQNSDYNCDPFVFKLSPTNNNGSSDYTGSNIEFVSKPDSIYKRASFEYFAQAINLNNVNKPQNERVDPPYGDAYLLLQELDELTKSYDASKVDATKSLEDIKLRFDELERVLLGIFNTGNSLCNSSVGDPETWKSFDENVRWITKQYLGFRDFIRQKDGEVYGGFSRSPWFWCLRDFSKITEEDGEDAESHKALYKACLVSGEAFCNNLEKVENCKASFKENIAELKELLNLGQGEDLLLERSEPENDIVVAIKEHCGLMWSEVVQKCKKGINLDVECQTWPLLCQNKDKFKENVGTIFNASGYHGLLGKVFDFYSELNFSFKCHILNEIEGSNDSADLIKAIERRLYLNNRVIAKVLTDYICRSEDFWNGINLSSKAPDEREAAEESVVAPKAGNEVKKEFKKQLQCYIEALLNDIKSSDINKENDHSVIVNKNSDLQVSEATSVEAIIGEDGKPTGDMKVKLADNSFVTCLSAEESKKYFDRISKMIGYFEDYESETVNEPETVNKPKTVDKESKGCIKYCLHLNTKLKNLLEKVENLRKSQGKNLFSKEISSVSGFFRVLPKVDGQKYDFRSDHLNEILKFYKVGKELYLEKSNDQDEVVNQVDLLEGFLINWESVKKYAEALNILEEAIKKNNQGGGLPESSAQVETK